MKYKLLFLFVFVFSLTMVVNGQDDKNIEADEILRDIKTLGELRSFFTVHDVGYFADIPNEPVRALEYKGDHKIASNIGVYLADMVYVMGTEGYKTADESYGAVLQLAEKAGLEEEFPELVIERYSDLEVNTESTVDELEKALSNSEKKLTAEDKTEFYHFVLFGNYIEKLHIVASLLQKPAKQGVPEAAVANMNRDLLLAMARQRDALNELSKLMIGYSSNIVDHKELRDLIDDYDKLIANKDNILKLKPAEIYQAKEIKTIEKGIKKVRSRIVK